MFLFNRYYNNSIGNRDTLHVLKNNLEIYTHGADVTKPDDVTAAFDPTHSAYPAKPIDEHPEGHPAPMNSTNDSFRPDDNNNETRVMFSNKIPWNPTIFMAV